MFAIEFANEKNPLTGAITRSHIPDEERVFENFILANKPIRKALRFFETYLLVDNKLGGKFILSLEIPIKFDERFKVTSVSFLISDFNLLSCELDNFTFNMLYSVILYQYFIKMKYNGAVAIIYKKDCVLS